MTVIKYALRKEGSAFAAGETDFRDSCGSLIDTNGCIVLSVVSGFATTTINFERHALRKGDFILLFYDSNISVDSISAGFRVRYISVAYPLVEEAIYKPLSLRFWDMLYGNPVLHPDTEQSGLLSGWWSQMEWIDRLKDGSYKEEMLKNNIRNLLMAVDTVAYDDNEGTLRNRRNHSWVLIMGFFKLLATHCHEERDVGFYADKLSITTTYLYKLCRKYMLLVNGQVTVTQRILHGFAARHEQFPFLASRDGVVNKFRPQARLAPKPGSKDTLRLPQDIVRHPPGKIQGTIGRTVKSVMESLELIGRDGIIIVQCHRPATRMPIAEQRKAKILLRYKIPFPAVH